MAEIVNLRRAKKQKEQAAAKSQAAVNRSSFGISKRAKEAAQAVRLVEARRHEGHRLQSEDDAKS